MKQILLVSIITLLFISCETKEGLYIDYYSNGNEKSRTYYKNGNIIYLKHKDENGIVTKSIIPYTLKMISDKPTIEDTVRFKLKVEYSEFNCLTVFIGDVDENGKMKSDPKYAMQADSLSINTLYDIPKRKGINKFFGEIQETTKSGDTLFFGKEGRQSFVFEYEVQ